MSAPVRHHPVPQPMHGTHVVEIQERRRSSAANPWGNIRARRAVKNAAILANLAEWSD